MSAVVMIDPAVAYLPGEDYEAYNRGTEQDVWLKSANGSASLGIVWPGASLFQFWSAIQILFPSLKGVTVYPGKDII